MSRLRVLIADDHQVVRMGVGSLVRSQTDMEVIGEAPDGARAIQLYRELTPDVLLLDLKMPVMDGVQVTTHICREDPAARVLILTHYDGDELVFKAVSAGARGYVTKEMSAEQILAAIRGVAAGEHCLPPSIVGRLTGRMRAPTLTGREQQVLEHLAQGLSNREIGRALGISAKTISIYVSNVLEKLEAKTRTEAVSIAIRRGLVRQ